MWTFLTVYLLCGSMASAQRTMPADDLIDSLSGPSKEMIAGWKTEARIGTAE